MKDEVHFQVSEQKKKDNLFVAVLPHMLGQVTECINLNATLLCGILRIGVRGGNVFTANTWMALLITAYPSQDAGLCYSGIDLQVSSFCFKDDNLLIYSPPPPPQPPKQGKFLYSPCSSTWWGQGEMLFSYLHPIPLSMTNTKIIIWSLLFYFICILCDLTLFLHFSKNILKKLYM